MQRKNSILAKGLCVALPVSILAAAHWFPWRKVIRRDLHQLEAYTIGTTAIVGTASVAMAISDSECEDHVLMLWLAACSAGLVTIAAHTVDAFVRLYVKVADLEAQKKALGGDGDNL
jgi:hypothetical protein